MKLLFLPLLFCAVAVNANPFCSKGDHKNHAKTTVADSAENNYDVHYVKMDLQVTNLSTQITGHVTTNASVAVAFMNEYVFELSPQLTIDSAFFDGLLVSVSSNGFVRRFPLPGALGFTTPFVVDVYYHGQPTGGTGFFTNGILHQTDGATGTQVTHTVSAAIHSRDWWPCKQSLQDKIDSADMFITVPSGIKVAGNGTLKAVTTLPSGDQQFKWSIDYPADYYLLSFAAAPYQEYNYTMHFSNSTDSMRINNYIYNDPTVLQNHQDELDSIALMINYFSEIFGRYPFYKEKFGICQTPLGGGMENQTMVSLGSLDAELIAHELSHQWWGDNVTCATLHDMWMNEGWATYCEQLFIEKFRGAAAMKARRTADFNYTVQSANGAVYVDDTTNEFRIYDGILTYAKGGAVAHMLRYLIGNDFVFFSLLRQYHQQYQFGTATTADFKVLAESMSGLSLDTFFNQWIYKEGYPTYGAKWFQYPNGEVYIRINQSTSKPTSIPHFTMPLEIKLTSAAGDTTVTFLNDQNVQTYILNWSQTMTGMVIDPNENVLNKTGAIIKDSSLGIASNGTLKSAVKVYPNPSRDGWHVSNLTQGMTLQLFNATGQKVWSAKATSDSIFIPSLSLPAANYILTISAETGADIHFQLLKQ